MSDLIRRALTEMADEARKAEVLRNLARTAMNDAVHFGRSQDVIDDLARKLAELESPKVQVEVPRQPLDPVSVEYAAIGGPRSWAEERVMNAAGTEALENADSPSSEALDALRGNALMRSRLERLTPEQRAQSVASLAFQAQDDARAASLQRAAAAERRRVQTQAAMDAIGRVASKYAVPAVATAAGGVGVYDALANRQMRSEDQRAYAADADRRLEGRRLTSEAMLAAMDGLGQDITFDSGLDPMEDTIREFRDPSIPPDAMPTPDIFTEDPSISFDNESPSEAISRILRQRYGR
jgi:hypothetical protein